ncbi:MAG TPA: hypothetical protein DCQ36_02560 [Actinobacteria bacterium]|nr:hypothetical protein [Actinomycetota bacterium]
MSLTASPRTSPRGRVLGLVVALIIVVAIAAQLRVFEGVSTPAITTASTIFIAIVVQALPFLMLGVLLSGAIIAFVPPTLWQRILPKNPALAVPVAGCAGLALPGCECASVPIGGALMKSGVKPAAALTFLLAAPAINPVVLASTWVAFPGQPEMMVARFVASLAVAIMMGWLWLRFGKAEWLRPLMREHLHGATKFETFRRTATHDFLHAGGFLVIGAGVAAILDAAVPVSVMDSIADNPVLAILAMALLAVILCVCSEADAFIAASFTQFSPTAMLAFMVVGPMVDLKLVGMQAGIFGRRFAARFAPTTFVMAVLTSSLVGWWLLT